VAAPRGVKHEYHPYHFDGYRDMRDYTPQTEIAKSSSTTAGRREFLKIVGLAAASATSVCSKPRPASETRTSRRGLSLNYDNSYFYAWHAIEEMDAAGVDALVDQFIGTQVDHFFFCPNSQRSSVASKVRQSVWDGYDSSGGNDQPFLAGVPDRQFPDWPGGPNERQHFRNWVHSAWLLNQRGIDPYARWLARCRQHGIHPWLSMRMNDVHYVDNPRHSIHDRFWKEHPEYRRDAKGEYNAQCFDYGRPEVRAYQMAYVRELVSRYDLDGFELDWMRNPFYFKAGQEKAGLASLTEFTADVRRLLDRREKELGHRIELSARVPTRPETARALGFDVDAWVQQKLIDRLVVSPFLFSQFDVPIEEWTQLVGGRPVTLEAGLMVTIHPSVASPVVSHNLETARGAALSLLDRGADRIYLFNFFDDMPYAVTGQTYRGSAHWKAFRELLCELGSMETMDRKSRRHIVTNDDTRAPEDHSPLILPRDFAAGAAVEFTIPTGPSPVGTQSIRLRLVAERAQISDAKSWMIRVNDQICEPLDKVTIISHANVALREFAVPTMAVRRGTNKVKVGNVSAASARIIWLELAFSDVTGKWPGANAELDDVQFDLSA